MGELDPAPANQSVSTGEAGRIDIGDPDTIRSRRDGASTAEAAAVAAAISVYLTARRRAASAVAPTAEQSETVDRWVLAGRMQTRGYHRWARDVARGEEWRAAVRSP